ncbi:UDP-2-acetamido-2,6-beta-L-arabino-hexul-4-ose reductase [Cupriavidus laharis]|uniref:UDP-2-acetamido-2,6-beta-L-arabino-hexul-4-ose reductase n=1 Tax=Cupriavidus laharis TaxID=151654 RepID=A0ABN7YYF2_9BURK|nr:NAD-dependent epimerase/dehydratase family protein [Cupriavidus laharis]CAG9177276.1 UDP-2-acetamido-2,6-beta-L-arabino-hexul-4-ose reductase [Cupriavidus laharis]
MKVLVTGAGGFIGKNLITALRERADIEVVPFTRQTSVASLSALASSLDFVFHLAGVNRPPNAAEFWQGNVELTRQLCEILRGTGKSVPVLYTSSSQAALANPYGKSKYAAEEVLQGYGKATGAHVYIMRLPNVFGKWSRPNYNSVVATFCHNIARDLPVNITDPQHVLTLVYIDDVVRTLLQVMDSRGECGETPEVAPRYTISVGEIADLVLSFRNSRSTLVTKRVGTGLTRALYATYMSNLPPDRFAYDVPAYSDPRGTFAEVLKTPDCGQFSFFTAKPGVTRGGHYHHSKTEKFLVLKGQARFAFRHIVSDEVHEVNTCGEYPVIVETVPGWAHDITNVGSDELVVMLWANELFDRTCPDTISHKV